MATQKKTDVETAPETALAAPAPHEIETAIAEEEHEKNQPVFKLTIAENVVEKISAKAVQQIDGIVAMKGGFLTTIQEGLGGNVATKGVSADLLSDNTVSVDLDIILEYGKSAVAVFDKVKGVVVKDLEDMTGLKVSELTVNVVDVMSQEEYDKKHGADADDE